MKIVYDLSEGRRIVKIWGTRDVWRNTRRKFRSNSPSVDGGGVGRERRWL